MENPYNLRVIVGGGPVKFSRGKSIYTEEDDYKIRVTVYNKGKKLVKVNRERRAEARKPMTPRSKEAVSDSYRPKKQTGGGKSFFALLKSLFLGIKSIFQSLDDLFNLHSRR